MREARRQGRALVADSLGRANGSSPPGPVIKTTTLTFDDLGYKGWSMTVRTNPSARQYDEIIDTNDETLWQKFAVVVVDWNFVNDDGEPLGPPNAERISKEIPWDIRRNLIVRYFDLIRTSDAPKESSDNSTSTSTTEP